MFYHFYFIRKYVHIIIHLKFYRAKLHSNVDPKKVQSSISLGFTRKKLFITFQSSRISGWYISEFDNLTKSHYPVLYSIFKCTRTLGSIWFNVNTVMKLKFLVACRTIINLDLSAPFKFHPSTDIAITDDSIILNQFKTYFTKLYS